MMPDWPQGQYGAILGDPPWPYETWSPKGQKRSGEAHYKTMSHADLEAMPVRELAAPDCVLFIWIVQTQIPEAVHLVEAWGFTLKSVAFAWMKGDGLPLFPDDVTTQMGMGKWTRAEFEQCWLATLWIAKAIGCWRPTGLNRETPRTQPQARWHPRAHRAPGRWSISGIVCA